MEPPVASSLPNFRYEARQQQQQDFHRRAITAGPGRRDPPSCGRRDQMPPPSAATAMRPTLANFSRKAPMTEQTQLLRRHAGHQAVLGDLVGRGVEVGVALAFDVIDVVQQGQHGALVLRHLALLRDQVQRDVAFAAQGVGVVVDRRVALRAVVLVLARTTPAAAFCCRTWAPRPSRRSAAREAALDALDVGLLGAFAQAVQQLADVPVAGVVVLDVAGLLEVDGDQPVVLVPLGSTTPSRLGSLPLP